MSYAGISVRDALQRLNATTSGWFLPQVQRQYVWGSRHQSEEYVCLLMDSLFRRYPIGGIVLWETTAPVPYREFVGDYTPGRFARLVDEGRYGAAKSLVYDGQQRLQTLFTVLLHRLNDRVLYFDILFDRYEAASDETGFHFRERSPTPDPRYVRMTELVSGPRDVRERVKWEARVLPAAQGDEAKAVLARENLAGLWDVFVDDQVKSIAYFNVRADSSREVEEIFRRLNIGGVQLTQVELVLAKLKAQFATFEEDLWELSSQLEKESGGFPVSSDEVLQFLYLMTKETSRIDESRLMSTDIIDIHAGTAEALDVLMELARGYLNQLFAINHRYLVPQRRALLPIAAFLAERRRSGREWRIIDPARF